MAFLPFLLRRRASLPFRWKTTLRNCLLRQFCQSRSFSQGKTRTARNFYPISLLKILLVLFSIVKQVKMNRVTVIRGSTGCGKTTQVPQFIIDYMAADQQQFNVIVTQPRRIAAMSIAKRVAEERNWQLGDIVGYQVGMDRTMVGPNTRLLYCTTGVLLQKLITRNVSISTLISSSMRCTSEASTLIFC